MVLRFRLRCPERVALRALRLFRLLAIVLTFGLNLGRPQISRSADPASSCRVIATKERVIFRVANAEAAKAGDGLVRILETEPHGTAAARVVLEQKANRANEFSLDRFDGARDRLFSSFTIERVSLGGEAVAWATNRFVEEFQAPSRWNNPMPTAGSKKGLQVQMVDDALALGIKHAALNVNLTALVDLSGASNGPSWTVNGRVIQFQRGPVSGLDQQIRPLTASNVVVSLILLTYASGQPQRDALMVHPRYDVHAPNHLGAFNTMSAEGALHLRACLEFLADRYSAPEYRGHVVNYILGNEVNSHWFWANMGHVTMEEFAEDYLRTARIASVALRQVSASAHLYLSLEHHWSMRYPGGDATQAFPGRSFLDYFARRAKEQGDFEWHLAFHPYPENLFEPRTWKDRSATNDVASPRITFKNLEVLPRYLARPEMLWRGQPRRILLSEQGFHTVNRPEGELWQAAAYAYAYYKASRLPGIDAFILHRHVDHRDEGGLNLGLWSRKTDTTSAAEPARRKRIYEVFQAADTADWERNFEFALPVIGIKSWAELWPGQSASTPAREAAAGLKPSKPASLSVP